MKPDSLIFDMDGTLWDAIDTYALAWNRGLQKEGVQKTISKQDLHDIMGWERKKALAHLLPEMTEPAREQAYETIVTIQHELILTQGGTLYDGVRKGVEVLSKHYPLFIISNCPKDTIKYFLQWSGLAPFFTDELAHGVNSMPKHHNIKLLMQKHGLKQPVYIGDTEGDQKESGLAGVPFVFVRYGFGEAKTYERSFDSFDDLTAFFVSMKEAKAASGG